MYKIQHVQDHRKKKPTIMPPIIRFVIEIPNLGPLAALFPSLPCSPGLGMTLLRLCLIEKIVCTSLSF